MSNLSAKALNSLIFKPGLNIIIAVGNTLRSDDGVGPYIASCLKSNYRLKVIDAKDRPENVIDEVIDWRPSKVLIIDAADFKGLPGEIRIVKQDLIPENSLSTHAISLKVIAEIISQDSKAEVEFLGIQPRSVSLGEEISREVISAAGEIIEKIKKEFSNA